MLLEQLKDLEKIIERLKSGEVTEVIEGRIRYRMITSETALRGVYRNYEVSEKE